VIRNRCNWRPFPTRAAIAAALFALLLTAPGCVERRFTIRSNPPGAQVYVDDYPIGTTPCSVSYTYYGTRKIRLVKDGFETVTILQPIPAPWYQYFPIDFVTENLVPGHIRDERVVIYQMQPAMQVPREELISRAEALRQNGRLGAAANAQVRVTPPPGAAAPVISAPLPNTLPAPSEIVPSPMPAPLGPPTTSPPPTQFIPPGQYPPPGAYAPPAASPAAPSYQPIPTR
jgi:hypothetical protein